MTQNLFLTHQPDSLQFHYKIQKGAQDKVGTNIKAFKLRKVIKSVSVKVTFLVPTHCLLMLHPPVKFWFVCVDALRPSQQFFSHVVTFSCLHGLNQY